MFLGELKIGTNVSNSQSDILKRTKNKNAIVMHTRAYACPKERGSE